MFKEIYIETERLLIKPYNMMDLDELYNVYSDENVMAYIPEGVMSYEWVKDLMKWMIEVCYETNTPDNITKFAVSILHKKDNKIIGWCGLGSLDCKPEDIEIFFGLSSEYWGKGLASEAARAMIDYGFNTIGLERIVAVVDGNNIASQKVIEKLGMNYKGRLILDDPDFSGYDGELYYEINKDVYIEDKHEKEHDMLERMNDFFDKRIDEYDTHMRETIEKFDEFYEHVIQPIEKQSELKVLLLGCGTGAEAEFLFERYPNAQVTCYDLSTEMLQAFSRKFSNHNIELRQESYFNLIEEDVYDYVIAVMTMHHWDYNEKLELYNKINKVLKPNGLYIEGDYYVTLENEVKYLNKRAEKLQDVDKDIFYHIDIPFHHTTQERLLTQSGFNDFQRIYINGEKEVHVVTCDKYTKLLENK